MVAVSLMRGYISINSNMSIYDAVYSAGMLALLLAFLGVSVLVIVTPGPDTAITIRNTLLGGRPAGIATALGVSTGQAIWAGATSIGIVAVLVASEPLFLAIKYAGAAYLAVLGVQCLYAAWRGGDTPDAVAVSARRLRPAAAFRHGVISDLGNPKMAVFFASLLPQFIPEGGQVFLWLLGLGLVFSLLTFSWLAAYAFAIDRAGALFRRSRLKRWVEAATGAVLIALGLKIATER
jgi:threonine/homoserine/homoserine lactone efflux protein